MCQMCDEYENELVRLGLLEDARRFREGRKHEASGAADRVTETRVDDKNTHLAAAAPGDTRNGLD
jgi:hypothetical protein